MSNLKDNPGCIPARYIVAAVSFSGLVINYFMRTSINLAIVAMVIPEEKNNTNVTINECKFEVDPDSSSDYDGDFEWNEWIQSLITTSFYIGYMIGQVPGGRLCDIYGPKMVYGIVMILTGFLCFIIPSAAYLHYWALIVVRFCMGLLLSPSFPSTQVLFSSWAPPNERGTLTTFSHSGVQIGTVLSYSLSGIIIHEYGWESIFYIQGVVAILWSCMWFFVVSNTPEEFKWISKNELKFITESIGDSKTNKHNVPFPWKSVLLSPRVWVIAFAAFGHTWGFYTLLTDLPLYMKSMLLFDIHSNGFFSAVPYLGQLIFGLIVAFVSDALLKRKILPNTTVRKLVHSFTQLLPAICLLCLQLVECDKTATVILIITAVSLNGGSGCGFLVNIIEISPNFAGTVLAFTKIFDSIPGFIAPMLAGALLSKEESLRQWRKIFNITSGIYIAETIIYILFASSKEEKWNKIETKEEKEFKEANTLKIK